MSKFDDLKKKIADMYDKVEDKNSIEQFTQLNTLVDECEAEHRQLMEDNTQLLKDYKEVVKSVTFKPTGREADNSKEDFSFESFTKNYNFKGEEK